MVDRSKRQLLTSAASISAAPILVGVTLGSGNAEAAEACIPPCFPLTPAEDDADVTPTDFQYPSGDIRRYGAGTTSNDTSAVQAAIKVASADPLRASTVTIPLGEYVVDTLTIDASGIEIVGLGRGSILRASNNIPAGGAILVSLAGGGDAATNQPLLDSIYGGGGAVSVRQHVIGSLERVVIRGVRFISNANNLKAIWTTGFTRGCVIEECYFDAFQDSCITLNGSWSFRLIGNYCAGRNDSGTAIRLGVSGFGVNGGSTSCNALFIAGNWAGRASIALQWDIGSGGAITGNTWEICSSDGARLFTPKGFAYTGNYHEAFTSYGLRLGGEGTGNTLSDAIVEGNYFNTSTAATAAVRLNEVKRCRIVANRFSGSGTLQYHVLAALQPGQIESNEIAVTDLTSTYFAGLSSVDQALNVFWRTEPTINEYRLGSVRVASKLSVVGNVGFYGKSPVAKPTVTGSWGGNAAGKSLAAALAALGLVTDSTTL
jgi:hypothetical protein